MVGNHDQGTPAGGQRGRRRNGHRSRPVGVVRLTRQGEQRRRRSVTGRDVPQKRGPCRIAQPRTRSVSYTHLRAHETDSYLVCRLLLEKKKKNSTKTKKKT